VRRYGLQRVQARLATRPLRPPPVDSEEVALRTAWVVEVAARRGLWPANCLQRSLTLWWLLRRRGVEGDLRIGVRRRRGYGLGGPLDFHAWVEHRGAVLNDRPDIRRFYATFDRAIAPPGTTWG